MQVRGAEGPVVVPPGDFAAAAAARIAEALRAASDERGQDPASLMLTGGSTVRPVYEHLADEPGLPWPSVEIFFGDERAVGPDDPDSNHGMAHGALLSRVPIAQGAIHRMRGEHESLEAAAREYDRILPGRVDLLLLGVGADGHIASLFPGAPQLREVDRRVVPSEGPVSPRRRLTVTPPVIRDSRRTIVLVAGERKAAAVRRALAGPTDVGPEEILLCPALLVRRALWIVDEAAAGLLPDPA